MRTRSNIISGKGLDNAVAALENVYPAGKIAVVYDDREEALRFISKCKKTHDFVPIEAADAKNAVLSDAVRFVLGIGGGAVISGVKRLARDKKFAFLACGGDYRYFTAIHFPDGTYSVAEFVYFDTTLVNAENDYAALDLYVSAFSLYTEMSALCLYDSGRPFCDRGMEALAVGLKNLLLTPIDESNFASEYASRIKMSVDYINEARLKRLYVDEVASEYGEGVYGRFLSAYFANLMLFSFTKWNFCDMLIPAEKIVADVKSRPCGDLNKLPTKAELHKIAEIVRGLTELPKVDYDRIFTALKNNVTRENPIFALIVNRGILDAIAQA